MQLCGQCGEYNPEESTFCGRCGNRLNNKCPDCGFQNLPQQAFCGSCGKQLQASGDLPGSASKYGQPQEVPRAGSLGEMVSTAKSRLGNLSAGDIKSKLPTNDQVKSGLQSGLAKMSGLLGGQPEAPAEEFDPTQWVPPPPTEAEREQAAREVPQPPPSQISTPATGLERYAVLSVELVPAEGSKDKLDPEALEQARRQGLDFVHEHLAPAGAQLDVSKNNVAFASFSAASSLEQSLERAIEAAFTMIWEDVRFENLPLKPRIGLDIESGKAKNPLTATMERMVAKPGSLVVSKAAYAMVQEDFQAEKIGPLLMGDRNMTFYRLIAPGTEVPELAEEAVQAPSQPAREELLDWDHPSGPPPSDLPASVPASEPAAVPPPSEPASAPPGGMAEPDPSTTAFQPEPEPLPEPQAAPESFEPEPQPATGQTAVATQEPEPASTAEEAPDPDAPPRPAVTVPEYSARKQTRQPNLTYGKALEALSIEFRSFLGQGPEGKGKVISLSAADGLGKSHLALLARASADPQSVHAAWLAGQNYRCFHRNQLPLYFWLELMQNPLSLIFEGQVARDVRQEVVNGLSSVYNGEIPPDHMAFLSDLLSINPPRPLSEQLRDNIGLMEDFFLEFFRILTRQKPLVLIMEDAHFADAASLDVLLRLIDKGLLEMPVLLLMTHTRDFYPADKLAAILQKVACKELVVSDMNEVEAEAFMNDGPLGGNLAAFPPHLIDMIIRHARGQSIYLEEALRYLFLQGILTVDPATQKFVMAGDYAPGMAELPDTLEDLIIKRTEFLSDFELYLLQMASILGEKFSFGILEALFQSEKDEFEQALHGLYNHGFIVPDPVNTAHFRHGLIWEAVYRNLPPDLRMEMHQLVSETLEGDLRQNLTVNPMLIAYHAENGELPNRALNYWNLAGIYCAQVGSLTGMNMAMGRAMQLLAQTAQAPLHREEMAIRTFESLGAFNVDQNPDMAIDMLKWVSYYRRKAGEADKLIEPLSYLASAYENKGSFTEALASLEEVLGLVDADAYPVEAASLLLSKMEYLFTLGKLQQTRELIEKPLMALAVNPAAAQDPEFFAAYLNSYIFRSQILLAQCDPAAFTLIEEGLRLARERSQSSLDIALQLIQGQGHLKRGQYEACNREADGLLNAIEKMEDPDWFLAQWGLLAMNYHCELTDWESASQLVLTVMTNSENARDYHTWVLAQLYAGYITAHAGNLKEGCDLLEKALELSAEFRFAGCALTGWRFLAEAELMRGNRELAAQIAAKAVEIANKPEIQNHFESIKLRMLQARALVELGDVKGAGKLLEPLWQAVAKSRFQPLVAECCFEIGTLYKRWAQDAPPDLSRKHLMRSMEFFLKAKSIWLELHHMPNVRRVDASAPQL